MLSQLTAFLLRVLKVLIIYRTCTALYIVIFDWGEIRYRVFDSLVVEWFQYIRKFSEVDSLV